MRSRVSLLLGIWFCFSALVIPTSFPKTADAQTQESSAPAAGGGAVTIPARSESLIEAWRLLESADIVEIEAKIDSAIKSAKQNVEKREKESGHDHASVGEALLTLGLLYILDRDFVGAEKMLKRARSIYEKVYVAESLQVGQVLRALAFWEMERGIGDQAEQWLKQALAIREKVLSAESLEVADAVFDLAEYYQSKGDYKRADPLYERVLSLREKQLPANAPLILQVMSRQACVLRKNGERQEAAELEFRAGVGPEPEYEENGKYKKPVRFPLDGKVVKRGRFTYPPMANAVNSVTGVSVSLAIDPTGRVIYACSQDYFGQGLIAYLVERSSYRSKFKPTFLDKEPVLVTGFMRFLFPGAPIETHANPFHP